jgi:hypothetical protein
MEEEGIKRLGHLIIKAKSGEKEALNETVERLIYQFSGLS